MRKLLLSTSALVAASFISSSALADVTVKGSVEWEYSSQSSDLAALDGTKMGMTNEVYINFTNKTDNGLTVAYTTQLDTDAVGGGNDDNALSISGGFGKIVLGNTDGAEDAYTVNPGAVTAEESTPTLNTNNNIATSLGAQLDGNANKLTYHLPAMGGLTAGVSTIDAGSAATDYDTTSFGAKYLMSANGSDITIGYTTASQDTAAGTADNDSSSIGVSMVSGAMTVIASQTTLEKAGEDITTQGAGVAYTLANGIKVGLMTLKSEDDIDTGEEYSVNSYEAIYNIAAGLDAVITVSDYDYKKGTANTTGKVDDSGTITTLNIKASF